MQRALFQVPFIRLSIQASMTLSIRTVFSMMVATFMVVALVPAIASAQSSTAQLIVVTRTATGSTPSTSGTVVVSGTGPSLTSTPTSSGVLTYASSFASDTRVVTLIPGSYSVAASHSGSSISYASACSGFITAGEVRTCTITANVGGGNARVNVSINVINDNGGTRTPGDFVISVSGQNTSVSSFQGTVGSVQVTLGAGSYSIDAASSGSYSISRSVDCSGTITDGETRNCAITLNDQGGIFNSGSTSRLTCSPSRQSAYLGNTVTFAAQGGSGPYSWVTADRTFINVGPQLNVILGSVGTQTVYVTAGYETASCTVDVYNTVGSTIGKPPGSVLGSQTQIPGLPNTGFAPNMLGTVLALVAAFVALPFALFMSYSYVRASSSRA